MTHEQLSHVKRIRGLVPGYKDMKPTYRVEPFLNRIDSKQTLNNSSVDDEGLNPKTTNDSGMINIQS